MVTGIRDPNKSQALYLLNKKWIKMSFLKQSDTINFSDLFFSLSFVKSLFFGFLAGIILISCELKLYFPCFKFAELYIKLTLSILAIDCGTNYLEKIILRSVSCFIEKRVFNILIE